MRSNHHMVTQFAAMIVLALSVGFAGAAESGEIIMGKVAEYPHAGIALAVPEGFVYQNLSEPFDVMRAVLAEKRKVSRAVSLSVFPVDNDVTAESFADEMTAELKKNLAIRHLHVGNRVELPVAGTTGTACMLKYTFRGMPTSAARVYFIRDIASPKMRLCYVLTAESAEAKDEKQAELLRVLGAVMKPKMLRFTPIRRFLEAPVELLGRPHKDHKLGFVVRPPRGWFVTGLPVGVEIARTDYLNGGTPMPTVRVIASDLTAAATSQAKAKECLALASKALGSCEIACEGEAKLAGIDGYQFILRKLPPKPQATNPTEQDNPPTTTKPAKEGTSAKDRALVTIVQRLVCTPAGQRRNARSYSIVLVCQGGEVAKLEALMDKIAEGFEILDLSVPPAATSPKADGGG